MSALTPLGNAPTQDWPMTNPDGSIKTSWLAWFNAVTQRARGAEQSVVVPQSKVGALIPTLNPGTFIYVSDYAHWLYWDGTSSNFADEGSDYYALGQRASGSPGWHLVDGTPNVPYLKADGSLGSRSMLNVAAVTAYLAAVNGADSLNAGAAANAGAAQSFTSKLWYRQ